MLKGLSIALAVSFLFSNILPHRVTYLKTSIFLKNTPKLDVIFTLNSLGVFAPSSDKIYFYWNQIPQTFSEVRTSKIYLSSERSRCLFSRKLKKNLRRHQIRKHKNETEVAKAVALKIAEERDFDRLRLSGDYHQNCTVLALEVVRMATKKEQRFATSFLPCMICMGLFMVSELWRHQQNCLIDPIGFKRPPKK